MNFIVFDLEATCWPGKPADKRQEIIEIGALRMSPYGEVISTFSKFVRPLLNPVLSPYCLELTSISQIDINRANSFPEVIDHFLDWAEIDYEDYWLCSWGSFDKELLLHDCLLHDLDDEWVDCHINIRRQYHEIKRLRRKLGLKSAVEKEGFEFTGAHHRAFDDAENLAKIFSKYLDEWRY